MRKVTNTSQKTIGVPKTNEEKFLKLRSKNPALEKLKETFDLKVDL